MQQGMTWGIVETNGRQDASGEKKDIDQVFVVHPVFALITKHG